MFKKALQRTYLVNTSAATTTLSLYEGDTHIKTLSSHTLDAAETAGEEWCKEGQMVQEVVRQALVEYLAYRGCYVDATRQENLAGIALYVERRYALMNEKFRKHKTLALTERIDAALNALKYLNETE